MRFWMRAAWQFTTHLRERLAERQRRKASRRPRDRQALLALLPPQGRAGLAAFLASNATLDVPAAARPRVSIIIPVHNQAEKTFRCLSCLTRITIESEVIVADNASHDQTAALLSRANGVQVIRNAQNVGYGPANNQAAAIARGEYLLLLNNDAYAAPGSIERAAAYLDADATIGAVGAKLLYVDGAMQEAGCIVWRNGSVTNLGRKSAADDFTLNYVRDVDYCSAAFLLVRRTAWDACGGFDDRFAPAYYEDVDLCFSLREQGYRVVYHPGVEVIHELNSSQSSLPAGRRDLLQQQRAKFVDKRRDRVRSLMQYSGPRLSDAAMLLRQRSADPRPRVLLLALDPVGATAGSGSPLAVAQWCARLRQAGYQVTLAALGMPMTLDAYRTIPLDIELANLTQPLALDRHLEQRSGFYDAILAATPEAAKQLEAIQRRAPASTLPAEIVLDIAAWMRGKSAAQRAA